LFEAFRGFHLDPAYGDVDGLWDWYQDTVVDAYRAPMVDTVNRFDGLKYLALEHSPIGDVGAGEELFILSMFQALDTIEALAARLPTKVSVLRSLDAVQQRGPRVRVPKTLRMWKKVNKVLICPTPSDQKVEPVAPLEKDVSDWRKGRSDHQLMMDLHAQLMAEG
jgi:hypothetical protein